MISPELNFRYLSQPTQLRISKPCSEHSHGSPEFSNQNLRQIGPGVPELGSDKQTDKQRLQLYIYIDVVPKK